MACNGVPTYVGAWDVPRDAVTFDVVAIDAVSFDVVAIDDVTIDDVTVYATRVCTVSNLRWLWQLWSPQADGC